MNSEAVINLTLERYQFPTKQDAKRAFERPFIHSRVTFRSRPDLARSVDHEITVTIFHKQPKEWDAVSLVFVKLKYTFPLVIRKFRHEVQDPATHGVRILSDWSRVPGISGRNVYGTLNQFYQKYAQTGRPNALKTKAFKKGSSPIIGEGIIFVYLSTGF